MPVIDYVDPAILDDPNARDVPEITLSYTFMEDAGSAAAANAKLATKALAKPLDCAVRAR